MYIYICVYMYMLMYMYSISRLDRIYNHKETSLSARNLLVL